MYGRASFEIHLTNLTSEILLPMINQNILELKKICIFMKRYEKDHSISKQKQILENES